MKISEWLGTIGAWTVYKADPIAERFTRETGLQPCWPTTTVSAVNGTCGKPNGIEHRVFSPPDTAIVLGFQIAESLADEHAADLEWLALNGRSARFEAARKALVRVGN